MHAEQALINWLILTCVRPFYATTVDRMDMNHFLIVYIRIAMAVKHIVTFPTQKLAHKLSICTLRPCIAEMCGSSNFESTDSDLNSASAVICKL